MLKHLSKKLQQQSNYISCSALTDIGLVRKNNEDSYLSLPEYQLWAVADGMGGHEGGEIASAIAISVLKNAVVAGESLAAAIQHSHHTIKQATFDGIGKAGMASTIVALKIHHGCYQVSWVGDSRAYLYRSILKPLSKDHSYIQLMLDQGLISDADIEGHPYNHAVTQALGLGETGAPIKVDKVEGILHKGDIFLLCSDGLSGEVSNDCIENIVSNKTKSLSEKAKQLVDKALATGGEDNISLILIEIE